MSLTREQRLMRQKGLGSSDIPILLGLTRTPVIELWRSKVEPLPEDDPAETKAQKRGNALEPVVARLYEVETGYRTGGCLTLSHPAYDWWLATPDLLVWTTSGETSKPDRICEIKTRWQVQDWSQVAGDPVDLDAQAIRVQIVWQLAVVFHRFGISICDLVVLSTLDDMQRVTLERDARMIREEQALLEIAGAWWQKHVVEKVPPPPDASEEYARWIGSLPHGKKTLKLPVELPAKGEELRPLWILTHEFLEERKAAAQAADKASLLGNELRAALRDIDVLETPWGRFRYQSVNGHDKTDWEAVARRFMGMICSTGVAQQPLKADMVKACEQIVKEETKKTKGHRALVPPKDAT